MSASANPTISRDDTVTIAIMGATGSGKSTFVNRASNSRLEESGSLESCTDNVVVAEPFLLDGKVVTLIDTPGFDDTTKTEAEVLGLISAFLSATYKQGRTLNGVIYMQNITIHRMGGMARKNFRLFRKLCGDATLKNVLIATNMWSDVNPTLAAQREREMAEKDIFFKSAIEKGARMVRHDNTVESAHRIIREIMGFTPAPLQIQRETVDENKPLPETDAGQDVKAGLEEQLTRYKTEVAELRGTIQELLQAKDDKHREDLQELREAMRDLQGQLTKVQAEAHRLREEHEASRREYEEKMGRMAEAMAAREAELRMAREARARRGCAEGRGRTA
ncbi:uncharacterized protein PHACADRAFT_140673 [Phanerochaete carnosa HHB-10118-sp]|uniref:G domain-containing protein n=1 Tax=Phanerochaete carnosa (strain HHB-10118-sp) TaxID=650164 RepID=K5WH14_PHACS|nr:uncharacterized protein PHACADRAFT_140673 [Phanerochaete carnosa HHB-10118-sp]EKM58620.1 hypothetical protein PHACADRAFT_140673 [Phanerochaete carnosa HHB-10118-sp]